MCSCLAFKNRAGIFCLLAAVLLLSLQACSVLDSGRIASKRSALARIQQLSNGMTRREVESALRPYRQHTVGAYNVLFQFETYVFDDWYAVQVAYAAPRSIVNGGVSFDLRPNDVLVMDQKLVSLRK